MFIPYNSSYTKENKAQKRSIHIKTRTKQPQNVTPNVTPIKTFRFSIAFFVTPNVTPSVTPLHLFDHSNRSNKKQFLIDILLHKKSRKKRLYRRSKAVSALSGSLYQV